MRLHRLLNRSLLQRTLVFSALFVSIGIDIGTIPSSAIQFVPPQTDEQADPRDRPRGGGARPTCNDMNALVCLPESILAIVPESAPLGLTLSESPKLWFFSPYDSDEPIEGSFELLNEQEELVWQDSSIQLPSEAGFFSYQIPPEANLEAGQTYRWYFITHLDPDQPSTDVLLSARLKYQSAQLANLEQSSVAEVQTLADKGIWYDMVTGLAQAEQEQQDLWQSFLSKNGFEDLTSYPVYE